MYSTNGGDRERWVLVRAGRVCTCRHSDGRSVVSFRAHFNIYDTEPLYREAFLGPLRQLLAADLNFTIKVPKGNSSGWSEFMEGTIHVTLKDESCGKKTTVLVFLEFKDGLGLHGEGGLQAILSLCKFVSQNAIKLPVIILNFLCY